jgi:sarcosine oxidase subunit gamma
MLYRWHERHGATFVEHAGTIVVASYATETIEASAARKLGLCDLSTLPRWGVTGKGGFEVPCRVNRAVRQADADVLARLSDSEYLLLASGLLAGAAGSGGIPDPGDVAADSVYGLPRRDSHGWFAVSGSWAQALLATMCGVDLRDAAFGDGAVAQTSVARVSAVLMRADLGGTPCFFVLGSSTSAEYLWDALAGGLEAHGGAVVGIHALQRLSEQPG